jgi:hypothetical protein
MKLTLPLIVIVTSLFAHTRAFSQSGETKVEYQKGDKIAAVIELPYTSSIVEDAIDEFMHKNGVKTDRYKSFNIYRNTHVLEGEVCDIHCKVERKLERDRESSVVYLLIGRPGENMAVRTSDDRFKVTEAKELLNKMAPSIDAYNLDVQIHKQEEVVKKSEKKLLNLKDDQYDLEKKLKALQEKLAQNKNDQLLQNEDLNRQKDLLSTIQNKKEISQGKLGKQ